MRIYFWALVIGATLGYAGLRNRPPLLDFVVNLGLLLLVFYTPVWGVGRLLRGKP